MVLKALEAKDTHSTALLSAGKPGRSCSRAIRSVRLTPMGRKIPFWLGSALRA